MISQQGGVAIREPTTSAGKTLHAAEVFQELKEAFRAMGITPQAMSTDYESEDENGEPPVIFGWGTQRQAETFVESVKQLRKAAGLG
ncbi:hypothetical protein O1M07_35855 [Streptomyces albulus]|nr:hypothetical protein [Streptomyces noursei]